MAKFFSARAIAEGEISTPVARAPPRANRTRSVPAPQPTSRTRRPAYPSKFTSRRQVMQLVEMILIEVGEEPGGSDRVAGDLEIVNMRVPVVRTRSIRSGRHGRSSYRNTETIPRAARPGASSPSMCDRGNLVQALHLAHERGDVVLAAGRRAPPRRCLARVSGSSMVRTIPSASAAASRFGTMIASRPIGQARPAGRRRPSRQSPSPSRAPRRR